MNAMNRLMHAFIIVRTILVLTYALVVLATAWPVIDILAMVINIWKHHYIILETILAFVALGIDGRGCDD